MGITKPRRISSEDSTDFESSITQVGLGTSDVFVTRQGIVSSVAVQLTLLSGSGSAKVQYTLGMRKEIFNASANYKMLDWDDGAVVADTVHQFGPISGLQLVVTSGTWRLDIQVN